MYLGEESTMYYDNRRLVLSIFWTVLGIVLIVLSVIGVIEGTMYSGFGGGLAGVGALQIYRNLKYRRDENYREMLDIESRDERSRLIRMKAWSVAGYATVVIQALGGTTAMILGYEQIGHIMLECVALIVLIYWVAYLVINRRN